MGYRFLINVFVMFIVSRFYKVTKIHEIKQENTIALIPWKYSKHISMLLFVITISIYIILGFN